MNWKNSTLIGLLCMFPVFSATAIGPEHSGSWYWDQQNGHGFSIEIGELPDGTPFGAAYWYTYDNMGNPIFMLGTGYPDGDVLDVVFESPVGMIFGEFDPESVIREDGGTGRFMFTDENIASFQYMPSEFSINNWGHSAIAFMPLTKVFGIPISDSPELSALESRIEELEGLLLNVTRGRDPNTYQDTLTFTNMNVQIVSGSGATDADPNGRGNLIIGYNELRSSDSDVPDNRRSGSHMLVIGKENTYSAFVGMVVGAGNTASGLYSSVSGGLGNTASGGGSSVSGGWQNTASGDISSVSGGEGNTASRISSSVSGGSGNTAGGSASSVSGGEGNTASGHISSVSGGEGNTASGGGSSVSGGTERTASGNYDWVAGSLFEDN